MRTKQLQQWQLPADASDAAVSVPGAQVTHSLG